MAWLSVEDGREMFSPAASLAAGLEGEAAGFLVPVLFERFDLAFAATPVFGVGAELPADAAGELEEGRFDPRTEPVLGLFSSFFGKAAV